MWSSDSDLEMLNMLSDWSDLSSDDDITDTTQACDKSDDCSPTTSLNEVPDEISIFNEDAPSPARDSPAKGVEVLFDGLRCDVCDNIISEFRYTCVQCSDFDLCSACEVKRTHHHHYVLRVPVPRPFAEVQSVLATIRKHLMKRLDPITGPDLGEDDISIKSEIKAELDENDDYDNNGDVEDNSDEDNGENSGVDDNDSDEHNDDDNVNDEHNGNKQDLQNKTLDVTTNIPKTSLPSENEDLVRLERDMTISIKEEPQFEYPEVEDALRTDVVSAPAVPSTAKRKTIVSKQMDTNVNNDSLAKKVCTTPVSYSGRCSEKSVTCTESNQTEDQTQNPEIK